MTKNREKKIKFKKGFKSLKNPKMKLKSGI